MIEPLALLAGASAFLGGVWVGEAWAMSKARRHKLCPTCLAPTNDNGTYRPPGWDE